MGHMKDMLITIYNGGDEAVAAVERMGKDWREQLEQAADEIAILRADNSRRANLEQGLRDGIVRLSAHVDCPAQDNAANRDNTPTTLATPSEGSEQIERTLHDEERVSLCSEKGAIGETPNAPTLTDAEREAIERAADLIDAKTCGDSSTIRSLLERLK